MGLFEYVHREWSVLISAPLVFLTVLLLAGLGALAIIRYLYESRMATRGERLEKSKDEVAILERRLRAKDEQLANYRQLSMQGQADKSTAFAILSNRAIKERAGKVVGGIRNWYANDPTHIETESWMNAAGQSPADRSVAFQRYAERLSQGTRAHMAEFDRQFKIEAIALRDELITRLPPGMRSEERNRYEHPTNPLGGRAVADDLELLALHLPDEPGADAE